MTTKDVNEAVLAAFRVEHREQLEQIRSLLDNLEPGADVAHDQRVQDAFRLAHSLKGGARICDLREAERLGHGIETVLEQLGKGELRLTDDVIATIHQVLDAIEDWMSALDSEQPLPDTSGALTAIDQVLSAAAADAGSEQDRSRMSAVLATVFRDEYVQNTARLRECVARWKGLGEGVPLAEDIAEAKRIAHTLAGAAGVVGEPAVEAEAKALESLFQQIKQGKQRLGAATLRGIEQRLDTMDQAMSQYPSSHPSSGGATGSARRSSPKSASATAASTSALVEPVAPEELPASEKKATATHESVRVSVESLDRLMRSCGDLWTDSQRVERFTRQLADFQHEVDDLERERESIRRVATVSLHELAATPQFERIARYLEYVDRQVGVLARRSRQLTAEQRRSAWMMRARSQQIQRDVHEARLVPAHSVFQSFRKMVRDLAKSAGKEIDFRVSGFEVRADRMVLQALKDPLMHILRNCLAHGIESPEQRRAAGKEPMGLVAISFQIVGGRLLVVVEDDGTGINVGEVARKAVERGLLNDAEAAQQSDEELTSLVLTPGFSTSDEVTELAGRGMGLSIVHDAAARLQGEVKLEPREQGGTRIALSVPISVSTLRVLLVACGDQTLAIPVQGIERLLRQKPSEIETVEGRPVVMYQKRPIPLVRLSDLLGIRSRAPSDDPNEAIPIVLLKSGTRRLAVEVDALVEERNALVLDLDEFARCREFAGVILLEDGQAALVLQPAELLDRTQPARESRVAAPPAPEKPAGPPKILVVDDSFTTRTLEKSILEAHGYEVGVAVDGVEALAHMRREKYAVVISDIEMPRMDGFVLLEQMKADKRLSSVPVILVTSRDRQEDQQRGLQLGADAYIMKRKFDHQDLLATIEQVL